MGSTVEHNVNENSMQEELSITENQANVIEIPDWCSLKQRFNDLFEKWETKNSVAALRKTVKYLENCKTESASISALHCFGKHFKARKYATQIPVQPTSVSQRKLHCGGRKCVQSEDLLKNLFMIIVI